ncbi:hypothetical protein PO909_028954 [Leuciscus waleckii]
MGVQLEPVSLAFYSAPAVRRSGSHFLSLSVFHSSTHLPCVTGVCVPADLSAIAGLLSRSSEFSQRLSLGHSNWVTGMEGPQNQSQTHNP